ncbi:hypothetical protein, partial [Arsukibacterium sp. MJ3]|uniref:hypothetical protein n=1 Tax=Arsukibacterium sp. MJ3 TaxID=1632859 RepID=UPI001F378659
IRSLSVKRDLAKKKVMKRSDRTEMTVCFYRNTQRSGPAARGVRSATRAAAKIALILNNKI